MKTKIIKIEDITKPDFYPRETLDMEHVKQLQSNIENLDPIKINQDNLLINGWHRIVAHKQENLVEIKCIIVKTKDEDDFFNKVMEKKDVYSSLPYTQKERKRYGIKCYIRGWESKDIAKKIGVSIDTVNKWVKPYRDDKNKQLEENIVRLLTNGELSQSEIAEQYNVNNSKITDVKNKFSERINLLITKKNNVPKELQEEYPDIYNFESFSSDIWNVYKPHEITPETIVRDDEKIIKNLLFYYSQPFDTVYTTNEEYLNSSKKWFRRCINDINSEIKPKLCIIEENTKDLDLIIKKVKDDGFVSLYAKTLEEDTKILSFMENKLNLMNRIILPNHQKQDTGKLHHSYESILIFIKK